MGLRAIAAPTAPGPADVRGPRSHAAATEADPAQGAQTALEFPVLISRFSVRSSGFSGRDLLLFPRLDREPRQPSNLERQPTSTRRLPTNCRPWPPRDGRSAAAPRRAPPGAPEPRPQARA